MKRSTRVLTILTTLVWSIATAYGQPALGGADGATAKEKPSKLSGILGSLDWGASSADTLAFVRGDIDKRYEQQLAKADPIQIDTILKSKAKEFNAVKSSLVRFDGQRTGYETSFVQTEVLPRNNESLLKIDDLAAQRYFFFRDDGLWKIVVVYNSSRADSFAGFIAQIRKKYEKPSKVEWGRVDGRKAMASARWEDHKTRIVAEDMSGFYSAFVMRFIEVGNGTTWQDRRAHLRKEQTDESDSRADGLLADITGGDGDDDEDTDVVDELTGVEHSVDVTFDLDENDVQLRREKAKSTGRTKKAKKKRKPKKSSIDRRAAPKKTDTYIIY